MKLPIQYYYYYYYGGLPKNGKEYDLERLVSFIGESSKYVCALVKDGRLNNGFFQVFEEDKREGFRLHKWVEDVQGNVTKELRDLKISLLVNEDLNRIWDKLDIVGLTGVQLESKLNFWDKLFEKVREWVDGKVTDITGAFVADLKNAMKATNILIGSLTAAIPAFEPLKELKDFYELSIEINENLRNI